MLTRLSKFVSAAGLAAAVTAGSIPKPAAADTQSTLNTALAAAAIIGGLVLYNNYQHKRQAANTIVGYTGNGGTIYGDGRIVMPNGQTIYPNSNGQYPWGQSAYYGSSTNGYVYDTQRTGRWDKTHRHGSAYRTSTNGYTGNNGNHYGWNKGNNGNHNGWRNNHDSHDRHDRHDDHDHGH